MSANKKRSKENPMSPSQEKSIEAKMKNILAEITAIDAKAIRLAKSREILLQKYEELKDAKLIRDAKSCSVEQDWENENFEWSQRLRDTMKRVFKLTDFRPQQLQTINCILAKKDVILIAPTGGGKSLCYQLPAIFSDGLTMVVSPLVSLMEDQVWSLQKYGINAELLCASTDKNRMSKNNVILKQIADGSESCNFKIIYVTPERLAKSKRFMNALQKCYLAKRLHLIAVDEVHCISQFGNDFRPDYKFLGTLKTMFPEIPLLGVTATATTKVIVDVQKMLNLQQPIVFKAEFNRPNLYYHVMEKPADKEQCIELLYDLLSKRYAGQSGIIYAFSIADTEEIASELMQRGINLRPYHANLTNDRRTKIHSKWLSGEIQAVVATVAFGMGIDKPDVRFVIHHTLSKSMENYYQESGRAGRDGERAECILFYRLADISRITTMVFTEHTGVRNAYQMIDFAIDGISCRRDLLSKHFMDVWSSSTDCNRMCDRCYYHDSVHPPKMNITEQCLALYKIIDHAFNMDVKLTTLKLIDSWYQKGKSSLRVNKLVIPTFERFYAEQMVAFLIVKGYLKEDFHFTAFSTISYIKKGNKIAQEDDRIIFYGARVLNLPDINKLKSTNGNTKSTKSNVEPTVCTDSDATSVSTAAAAAPPKKKVKREKTESKDAHHLSNSLMDTSIANETSSEKKRKRKSEKKHNSESSTSGKVNNDDGDDDDDDDDDEVILVEGSDIIEID